MQKLFKHLRSNKRTQSRRLKRWRKHPFAIPIVFFVLLAVIAGSFAVFSSSRIDSTPAAHIAIINYDHHEQTVPTMATTVGDLLTRVGVKLNKGDAVEPDVSSHINQDNFRINVYRAVPVTVRDGTTVTTAYSAAATPRAIATDAGMQLYPEDRVTMAPITSLVTPGSLGQQVTIDRSVPLTMNVYGTQLSIRTHVSNVGELVKAKNVKLSAQDSVVPAASTPVTANMQVYIVRKGTVIQTVNQDIATPVQTIQDGTLAYGTTAIRQQGSPGKQVLTYQVNTQNGQEVGRTLLQSVTTVAPVTQVVVQGTNLSGIKGDMAVAGIAASDYNYADYIISHESNWNPAAQNASGAFGLCQALPGSKMASAGSDWATNPVTQLKWCNSYAQSHYGGWAASYNHWVSARSW